MNIIVRFVLIIMSFLWMLMHHSGHGKINNIFKNHRRYNKLKNNYFISRLYGQIHKQDQIYVYALDNKKLYISSKSIDSLNLENVDDDNAIKDNNEWTSSIRTIESQYDKLFPQHENFLTYLYMSVLGFDNVRGGSYKSKQSLTSLDMDEIHKILSQHGIDCLLCKYYSQSNNKIMLTRANNKMKPSKSIAIYRHLTCNCSYHDSNEVNLNELVYKAANSLLNTQQYISVTLPYKTKDPSIIIAGAGSGKTKVLAHRIAYLYLQHGSKDFTSNSLLATTFTNKASKELISRVELLIKEPSLNSIDFFKKRIRSRNPQWIGTFHSLAFRFLLSHGNEANWIKEYKILTDESERNVIFKDILKKNNISCTEKELKQYSTELKSFINNHQNQGIRSTQIKLLDKDHENYEDHSMFVNLYHQYEIYCNTNNYADFNELLLKTIELFESSPSILYKYQKQFQHILIDEFQDTNIAQYKLVKLLTNHTNIGSTSATTVVSNNKKKKLLLSNGLFLVGDDDQSIYAFRGSTPNIFQQVLQDYQIINNIDNNNSILLSNNNQSDTIQLVNNHIYKLEQNYRSYGNIVSASNAVIKKNLIRIPKQLWTTKDSGDLIQIIEALSDQNEAELIMKEIQKIVKNKSSNDQNYQYKDITILYRTKQQSIQLEKACISFQIPYKIIKSGILFFEREEIKHILAYLHLINNKMDNLAFQRIVNVPKRNLGTTSIQYLIDYADEMKLSLWNASKELILANNSKDILKPKALQALGSFITLIEEIEKDILTLPTNDIITYIIEKIKLVEYYGTNQDNKKNANDVHNNNMEKVRIENIQEFIELSKKFDYKDEEFNRNPITKFLNELSLLSSDYEIDNPDNLDENLGRNFIQLMTIHSSKGLEFPIVFISGLEMNLFPKYYDEDEEERRLFYVAMTRAQRKLYITYAHIRNKYGDMINNPPSKFLKEIPKDYYVFRSLNSFYN